MSTPAAPPRPRAPIGRPGRVGESSKRADGVPKVRGEYEYSSDMNVEGMLFGATLRSPHPSALICALNIGPALAIPGVHAVLTHADVPGSKTYGMEVSDQPVLAIDQVRYQGEPVAVVAADHTETARRAVAAIEVEYEERAPLVDAEYALDADAPALHEGGNVLRHVPIRVGDPDGAHADVVVTGTYEVGMQDQAFLGPESGVAIPDGEGGIDLFVATQWLHVDHRQTALALGLQPEQVRMTNAGVGGAFGGREDVSMQIHACMLALHTGRPVKMVYNREESFFGHVHRHPCRMRYEHGATRDGKLVYVRARVVLDGGAYASSSRAVCTNAACFAVGPYVIPNARIDSYVAYTNNPPCGAMRGFGAVQVAFAHEAQMDRLAAALEMDPVELRIANALKQGDRMPTGQLIDHPAPVAELLERVRAMPLPPASAPGDLRELPGGVANTTHGEGVKRGIGYGIGVKNVGFSEGFDDFSTARVRLSIDEGESLVEVHTAACEVGQGLETILAQIARTELDVERVAVLPADTRIGSAGSTSASRQTYVTGGAVKAACEAVRARLGEREAADGEFVEETVTWRHRPTRPLDANGQGDAHVQFAFSAHRAVVDVDTELGLVRVVELATTQEVGRAMNPQQLEGQIEGGTAQGLGLALLEEIQVRDGKVLNPSFTDYLLPTVLDMPPMRIEVLEHPDPHAPYGLKGVGEPPNISTPPAVAAALRDATGRPITRIPVKPEQIVGLEPGAAPPPIPDLDQDEFVARYGALYEHSPWVAERAWRERPFDSAIALRRAFERIVAAATKQERLDLLRAHPELGARGTAREELTRASADEQAAAGLDRPDSLGDDPLERLNAEYRERFDFPFIVCVREHTRESLLAWGRERLAREHDEEARDRARRGPQDRRAAAGGPGGMISTHVLDTALGRPAAGVAVTLERRGDAGSWDPLGEPATTDADGRVRELAPDATPGEYRLTFATRAYFAGRASFYPEVAVTFTIEQAEHHHVPLLLSPYGYSTYRGS